MAIINKDFRLKNGLIVEGSNATVNGYDVLTKSTSDQNYIIGLIGGAATSNNTPDTVVLRDANGDFAAGMITANLTGAVTGTVSSLSNHSTADLAEAVGGPLYYTDARVKDVLVNATKTNIQISEISGELHITAENGVTDSTTDDLAEGINNLYFTNARAQNAVEGMFDVAGAATTAENNAKSYADGLASNYDPAGSATTAENNAKGYADSLISDGSASTMNVWSSYKVSTELGLVDTAAQGYANTAEQNANAYTDNAVSGLNWKQAVNLLASSNFALTGLFTAMLDDHAITDGYRVLLTGQSTNSENGIYDVAIDTGLGMYTLTRSTDADAFGELVGAAVYVMEGTQYGSTSWVQSNHYLANFTGQSWTQFSGQGSVTAGTGIAVNGLEVSVNRTTVDGWYDASGSATTAENNAKSYADGLAVNYDAAGSASTAQQNAEIYAAGVATTAENNAKGYADSLAINYDPSGSAQTAETNANTYTNNQINALTTDDIEEGVTNHYYTDGRAQSAAVDLLTSANLTNIQIQSMSGQLYITAENGVADSTTDDLTEGSTNLYFTDQRVLDAVNNSTITPTAVEINNYRKEEATQQLVSNASTVNVHAFSYPYESVKYLVRVVGWEGGTKHSQITEILVTVDGNNNIAITEYGNVHTSTNPLATFSADYVGGAFNLTATTSVSGCEIIAAATMLSWAD